MTISLDANICIAIMREKSEPARRRLQHLDVGDAFMSAVVYHELATGVAKSRAPEKNAYTLAQFVERVAVLELTKPDAEACGRLRAQLELQGRMIGPLDILVAGQALARGLAIATNNVREFSRVPGLPVEDWLAPL